MNLDGKAKIIEAARKIISESGIPAASARAIAREAGMTTGAIYYYYKSKEDILYDVVDQHISVTTRVVQKTLAENFSREEIVNDLLEIMSDRFRNIYNSRLQFYLANEALAGNEELRRRYVQTYDAWISRVQTLINNYFDHPPGPLDRSMAVWLTAAIDGVIFQMLLGVDVGDVKGLMQVWEMVLTEVIPALLEIISKRYGK